jgi:hypothetical protein
MGRGKKLQPIRPVNRIYPIRILIFQRLHSSTWRELAAYGYLHEDPTR